MTTKIIVTALLLAFVTGLSAQKTTHPASLAFESVSFSTNSGNITITCADSERITAFEITGVDTHLDFSLESGRPADYFPMKLGFKPGKVTIRYSLRGEADKVIELKLGAKEEVKLVL
jgi:hypothetical protein